MSRWIIRGLLISAILFSGCIERREPSYAKAAKDIDTTQQTNRDSLIIELTGVDSMTVFQLLKSTHDVDYQSSAQGIFVQAIDSIPNGERTYWMYSVNDSMGQVACDQYMTRTGDRIRWHYRKLGE